MSRSSSHGIDRTSELEREALLDGPLVAERERLGDGAVAIVVAIIRAEFRAAGDGIVRRGEVAGAGVLDVRHLVEREVAVPAAVGCGRPGAALGRFRSCAGAACR